MLRENKYERYPLKYSQIVVHHPQREQEEEHAHSDSIRMDKETIEKEI